jgi:hypothetical protein
MATDFSVASIDAQSAATIADAVVAMIGDLAAQLAAVTPTTSAVQTFATDLAAQANNLSNSCLQNADGSSKPPGDNSGRAPYLQSAGL